jgi:hypothetical protein
MGSSQMTTVQPTPPEATHPSYWQAPSTGSPDDRILARLRVRLVALVAALVVQATIALLGVLPELPGVPDLAGVSDWYSYTSHPVSFWTQFAVMEFIAAVVVSLAFGPVVRIGDVSVIGRLVLGLGFVAVPTAAIVRGAIDAAQAAAVHGPAAAASSWLATAFFGTLFFGLPLIALAVDASRAPSNPRPV